MTARGARLAVVSALLAGGALVAVSSSAVATTATASPSTVAAHLTKRLGGLVNPVAVTSARDGLARLFVTEQRGTVRLVSGTTQLHSGYYLDLRSKVATSGNEQGLLSIVFDPHFGSHPYLWAAYTRASDGALVVSRFHASSAKATSVSASTEVRLFTVPHPQYTNHNGGQLVFGHDGYLYVSTGDGGGSGDPFGNAEKLTSLSGKLLRVDAEHSCGSAAYCIPASNPHAKASNVNERLVLDDGLRNAWRYSVDASDGTLWIGDVGQDAYEEVDHVTTTGGKDFGWSCREGRSTYNSSRCSGRTMTGPVYVYAHGSNDANGCAIIGGFAYHGSAYGFAAGLYSFSDYCSGHLWAIGRSSSGGYPTAQVGDAPSNAHVTGFGEDDGHEIYAVAQDGNLYRLVFTKR
jgi:glucose/arabinose dehydrogenase